MCANKPEILVHRNMFVIATKCFGKNKNFAPKLFEAKYFRGLSVYISFKIYMPHKLSCL